VTALYNKLIILDLDETLLHGTEKGIDRQPELVVYPYFVYIRPFAREFIDFCFQNFMHVAVWTSASREYAEEVCSFLFGLRYKQLEFIWARDRCTRKFNAEFYEWSWIKDLKKVKKMGFPLERVIMIDNTPSKLRRQYGNLVHVRDFGDLLDIELNLLVHYLPKLGEAKNVRNIEKRGWRNAVNQSLLDNQDEDEDR